MQGQQKEMWKDIGNVQFHSHDRNFPDQNTKKVFENGYPDDDDFIINCD